MRGDGQIVLYQSDQGDVQLDVRLEEETVWLNQAQIAQLFGKARSTISEHIKHIFQEGELTEKVVCRDFRQTTPHGAMEGKTQQKAVKFYNLELIISVGYRVRSQQGTQFRVWATQRLKDYLVKGFVLNDDRFKTGQSMRYFDELQERIREIRTSEKFFYQKIKDIYATSVDYNSSAETTRTFFKIVQNKLLWAISQQTAAELVYRRADASLPQLGMSSLDTAKSSTALTKQQACTAKNYLNEEEMKLLGLLVEQYLAFAETMAQQQTPMTMQDWSERLDAILQLNGRELLSHAGKISHDQAKEKSAKELETYRKEKKRNELETSLEEIEADIKRLETGRD